jgi:hypothetical protein
MTITTRLSSASTARLVRTNRNMRFMESYGRDSGWAFQGLYTQPAGFWMQNDRIGATQHSV